MNMFKLLYIFLKYSISNTKRYLSLFLLIIKYKPKSILEIGVYRGIRSAEMISVAKIFNKNLSFYGFDLFKKLTKKRKNYELSKFPLSQNEIYLKLSKLSNNINLFSGNTKKTLKKFLNKKVKVDFVFIDGGHHINTIMNDWKYSLKISNKKTIFIFDDYYTNNMSLADAIKAAGGPQNGTYKSEIEVTSLNNTGKKFSTSNRVFTMDQANTVSLNAMDTVHLKQISSDIKTVELTGEVYFPGVYPISENQTLSQLIRRAGGYTEYASPEAAFFQRVALKKAEEERKKQELLLAQKKADEEKRKQELLLAQKQEDEKKKSIALLNIVFILWIKSM